MRNRKLSIDFIRDIIVNEMELDSKRVFIYNQKNKIPPDDDLFVVVEYNGAPHIISSRNIVNTTDGDFTEYQELNTQEHIIIGLFSRNLSALQRKEEALMAINSVYAQSIQETNSFKIAGNSRIEDLSDLEGAARLYRFDIPIVIFAWYEKIRKVDFYDTFNVDVLVNP